jgi:hypothetical protein
VVVPVDRKAQRTIDTFENLYSDLDADTVARGVNPVETLPPDEESG